MRRTTTAAALATAGLALSACGGDGGPGPTEGSGGGSQSSISNSSTPTPGGDGSTSASPSPSTASSTPTDTGTPFDPKEFTSRLQKAVDAHPTVRIDVDVTLDEQEGVSASGVQDLANNALDMDVDLGGQELGYRLVDGKYYLAQPPKWVPVTPDSSDPVVEQTLEQIQLLSMRKQFDAFIAGVEQAGDKGSEKVDGINTTHYTATVDTQKANRARGQKSAPGTPEKMIYDVWLDGDDLIRQMTFTQDSSKATMTAKDWGEPVKIVTPKDSEIARAPKPKAS